MRLCKAFANRWSINTKLSESYLNKIGHSGRFLGRLLGPLLKTGLPLMEDVLKPLAKSVLILLGLASSSSTTDAAIFFKRKFSD